MKIIKATSADIDAVISSRIEMLKVVNGLAEDTKLDPEVIANTKEYYETADQTTVLAIDQAVIGCATICYITVAPTCDHPTGKRAHMMNVYTNSNYRHQGIAILMLKMLIDEAKQRGVTEISLDATELGRPVYEQCGFQSNADGMLLIL